MSLDRVKLVAEIADLVIRGWCALSDRSDKARSQEQRVKELEAENAELRAKAERKKKRKREQ